MPTIDTRNFRDTGVLPNETQPISRPVTAPTFREEETTAKVEAGTMFLEALAAVATVVLAIIGLAGIYPFTLAGVAAIVFGLGLVLAGGSVMSRFSRLMSETPGGAMAEAEMGGGMAAEFLGGVAGVVLGILALLNIYPEILLPVSLIVLGGALLLACGSAAALNATTFETRFACHETARRVASAMASMTNGIQTLVGLAGVVLGILALVNTGHVLTLTLLGFLCMGAGAALCSTALSSKMMLLLRR